MGNGVEQSDWISDPKIAHFFVCSIKSVCDDDT